MNQESVPVAVRDHLTQLLQCPGKDFPGIQKNVSIPVIPAFVYNDPALSHTFAERVTANLSVSNLFDKQPPLLYDAQYIRLSLSAKF